MTNYHNPVLLNDCIEGLNINPDGVYVDVTFGGGGHSREIMKHLKGGKLIAFDQDPDAAENAIDDPRFTLVAQNFRYMKNFLKLHKALPVDGILADLGVSSHQFDVPERGFSTRFEADLDMRMDTNGKLTAAGVLNTYSERELSQLFRNYGEVENAGKLAYLIVGHRKENRIQTVSELKDVLKPCMPRGKENQYLAQVFQALRIEVNNELEVLKEFLMQSNEVLKAGGRLVVISYHSLEDRLVKNFISKGKFEGEVEKDFFGNIIKPMEAVNRKIIVPGPDELQMNNRARSAKLRIAEKKI
ncbi:MAG TPA: 16S rRNA (cytosine(1402)-N(4))-methyltransferase RsmH [Bacteroidia bacterium]|jgi:16S rRNA (cytosine1402-N4)-methyltransferase|nr:16S rRNA (cytosine(1402)-N(4))-methyltransferase RsmH [Bacteroidia bacterium]